MALDDAGIPYSKEQPQDRIGVSFGTALGGIANAEYQHAHYLKKGTRGVNQTLALQVFGGSAEYVALFLKSIGSESTFYWYVTALCAIAGIVSFRMRDSAKEGYLRDVP